ncbi:hypothetical protein MSKU15_1287 [Komagataeibacter diospyri]|uniref:DUF2635 domain-containing protein n=1 Tax=Komagataeibacter diospyri TaxID=1932662 RepID=UPI00113CBB30|nr:DUF2635 domain-containing protein [Komagataeibacter diospyri]GCE89686.1 hypothetical protein MSKU15_1287 [Komagataeibacter diospyri]
MRLYPAAGLQIRDPITHAVIPAGGVEVPDRNGIPSSFYWQRRLRAGDATKTAPAAVPAASQAATPQPVPATPAEQVHA